MRGPRQSPDAPPPDTVTASPVPAVVAASPVAPAPVAVLAPVAVAVAEAAVPERPFDAKSFVDSLPARPGVYRMLAGDGEILYVGKARNLKSRVGSYFQPSNVHPK